LKVFLEVSRNRIRLWEFGARSRLVVNGELVGFARPTIEVGNWGYKVGNVERLPNLITLGRIGNLANELDCRIPDPKKNEERSKSSDSSTTNLLLTQWRNELFDT